MLAASWIPSPTKSLSVLSSLLSLTLARYLHLSLALLSLGNVLINNCITNFSLPISGTCSLCTPGCTSAICRWSLHSPGPNILTQPYQPPPSNPLQSGGISLRRDEIASNKAANLFSKVNTALQFLLVAVSLGAPILHYQVRI